MEKLARDRMAPSSARGTRLAMVHMAKARPGSDQVSSANPTHLTISPSRLGHDTRSKGPPDGIT